MGPLRPESGARTRRGQDRAGGPERYCGAAAPPGSCSRLQRQGSGCGSAPRPQAQQFAVSFRFLAPRLGRKPFRLCARTSSAPWGPRKWSSGPQVTVALPRLALHSSWSLGGSGAIESGCSPRVFMPCACGQSWPAHPDATPPPLPRPPPLCPRLIRLPSSTQAATLIPPSLWNHTDGSLSPAPGA